MSFARHIADSKHFFKSWKLVSYKSLWFKRFSRSFAHRHDGDSIFDFEKRQDGREDYSRSTELVLDMSSASCNFRVRVSKCRRKDICSSDGYLQTHTVVRVFSARFRTIHECSG
jgi:hypothetical protein